MENNFLKRLLIILVSLFLVVYVGYQVYRSTYSPIEIEIAQAYSAYDTIDVRAMVVRDETVIPSSVNGYLYYTCEDGARVSKNGTIAYVYANEEDAMAQRRIVRLEEEMDMLTAVSTQSSAGMVSLDLITKQTRLALKDVIMDTAGHSYSELSEKRMRLLSMLNKWEMTIGKEKSFGERIAELKSERDSLAKSFGSARGTVTSPVAGYFVSRVDGFENSLSYDRVTEMTVSDIQRVQSNTETISANAVGKIVGDYQWYFICVLTAEQASKLSVGKNISISLPLVSSSAVPVTVTSLNKDRDGNVAASFACSYMSDKLSAIRREDVEIRVQEYAGLYVRDSSLHFNEKNEPGVYIRVGDTIYFRKVNVIYHDVGGRYSVCETVDDKEYLQLYDDIVVSGRGLYDGKIIK